MKKTVEITVCDQCGKTIENPLHVEAKDFCNAECLVKYVQTPHYYEYRDAGYGDDKTCTRCYGTSQVEIPARYIFSDEKTIKLMAGSFN